MFPEVAGRAPGSRGPSAQGRSAWPGDSVHRSSCCAFPERTASTSRGGSSSTCVDRADRRAGWAGWTRPARTNRWRVGGVDPAALRVGAVNGAGPRGSGLSAAVPVAGLRRCEQLAEAGNIAQAAEAADKAALGVRSVAQTLDSIERTSASASQQVDSPAAPVRAHRTRLQRVEQHVPK